MSVRTWKPDGLPLRARGADALEFRLLVMASFPIFLVASTVLRLVPRRRRPVLPSRGSQSIIQEARAAAYTAVLPAFMN